MAELCCTVENCAYNDECLCCKGDINVGGEQAHREEDTCCESFLQRRDVSFRSSIEHPSRTISIDCEAANCIYNEHYKCRAEHVDIMGCGACERRETACGTFQESYT